MIFFCLFLNAVTLRVQQCFFPKNSKCFRSLVPGRLVTQGATISETVWKVSLFRVWFFFLMGVSKNRETPQNGWFILENPHFNGWFGGTLIFGNTLMGKKHGDPLEFQAPKKDQVWPVGLSPGKTFDESFKLFTVATMASTLGVKIRFPNPPPDRWASNSKVFVFSVFFSFSPLVLGVSWSNLRVAYFSNGLGKNQQPTTFFGSSKDFPRNISTFSRNRDAFGVVP